MPSIGLSQRIEIDLFGLQVPGQSSFAASGTGTVVAVGSGVITVRLDSSPGMEVTVSAHRVLAATPW